MNRFKDEMCVTCFLDKVFEKMGSIYLILYYVII